MSEDAYVDKSYCLSCSTKHSNRLEHHLEDAVSGAKNDPEFRAKAQQMLDQVRQVRRQIDELRINQLATQKLNKTI